jgi:hypothetical protein
MACAVKNAGVVVNRYVVYFQGIVTRALEHGEKPRAVANSTAAV